MYLSEKNRKQNIFINKIIITPYLTVNTCCFYLLSEKNDFVIILCYCKIIPNHKYSFFISNY
jgi:hypothetical protein